MTQRRLFGLRMRFFSAGVLLTLTTVAAAAWTLLVLSSLAASAAATVRDTDELTATTASLSSALEREDDALLVILGGASGGKESLDIARGVTDRATARLAHDADSEMQHRIAREVQSLVRDYRKAVNSVVAAPGPHPLERYHQVANPQLRDAVGSVAKARDERFEEARAATAKARDEVTRARNIVVLIAALAMLIGGVVAHRLARHVILPLRELAKAAAAIRDGRFETRVRAGSADEIGDVSEVFNDMTARLAEFHRSNLGEILRAKRALEATLRALPDAVLLIDGLGQIAATNPEADRLFEELNLSLPTTAEALCIALGAEAQPFCEALSRQHAFEQVALDAALRIERRSGARRVMPRVVPLAADDDHAGSVLVLSDVTHLARLDEMRSELVALASHELRTPLTTLRMSLLMLREAAARLDYQVRELVDNALSGVNLLGETVDELLDMTRIEAGAMRLNTECVNLVEMARAVAGRNQPRAEELGLRLGVHTTSEVAPVIADSARLRIVIDNLINNSLKYTERGGSIDIAVSASTRRDCDSVEVSVTDTGSGIPQAFEARVFEKFFRVEHYQAEREETPRGAGIGLYLCKEIVELHGGHIRCEAPQVGRGTRIVFDIPASVRS